MERRHAWHLEPGLEPRLLRFLKTLAKPVSVFFMCELLDRPVPIPTLAAERPPTPTFCQTEIRSSGWELRQGSRLLSHTCACTCTRSTFGTA